MPVDPGRKVMGKSKKGFDNFFDLGKGQNGYIALPYELIDSII